MSFLLVFSFMYVISFLSFMLFGSKSLLVSITYVLFCMCFNGSRVVSVIQVKSNKYSTGIFLSIWFMNSKTSTLFSITLASP